MFGTEAKINKQFLVGNPISDPTVVTALYTDPWYGLNNANNYFTWNVLLAGSDPLETLALK